MEIEGGYAAQFHRNGLRTEETRNMLIGHSVRAVAQRIKIGDIEKTEIIFGLPERIIMKSIKPKLEYKKGGGICGKKDTRKKHT